MVGHYNAHGNGNTGNPNRTCHCTHENMDNPQPNYNFVTMEEVNLAYENNDLAAFWAMSNHPIKSSFDGVPISCTSSGIFGIVPPCALHTLGGGILKYQFVCTNQIISPRKTKLKEKEKLDIPHQNIAIAFSRQSDNNMPRSSTRYVFFVRVCGVSLY